MAVFTEQLVLKMSGDIAGARRSLADIGTKIDGLGKKTKKSSDKAKKGLMGTVLTSQLLAAGIMRAGRAITSTFVAGARDARSFGKAMGEVRTISQHTEAEMKRMTATVLRLSQQFGRDPTETARGLYQAISAGAVTAADATNMLTHAMTLSRAGLTTTAQAVDVLTSLVNSYGVSANEAGHISDVLFTTVRLGKTRMEELAATLGRVAPLAARVGMTFEDLGAAIVALTKVGLQTDIAVTGLRQVIASVLNPTQQAIQLAKQLGVEFSAAALRTKGFANFLGELQAATGGSETQLAVLFGNIRALIPVLAITAPQGMREYTEAIEAMGKSHGAAGRAAKIMGDTIDQQLAQQELRWKLWRQAVGVHITEWQLDVMEGVAEVLKQLGLVEVKLGSFKKTPIADIKTVADFDAAIKGASDHAEALAQQMREITDPGIYRRVWEASSRHTAAGQVAGLFGISAPSEKEKSTRLANLKADYVKTKTEQRTIAAQMDRVHTQEMDKRDKKKVDDPLTARKRLEGRYKLAFAPPKPQFTPSREQRVSLAAKGIGDVGTINEMAAMRFQQQAKERGDKRVQEMLAAKGIFGGGPMEGKMAHQEAAAAIRAAEKARAAKQTEEFVAKYADAMATVEEKSKTAERAARQFQTAFDGYRNAADKVNALRKAIADVAATVRRMVSEKGADVFSRRMTDIGAKRTAAMESLDRTERAEDRKRSARERRRDYRARRRDATSPEARRRLKKEYKAREKDIVSSEERTDKRAKVRKMIEGKAHADQMKARKQYSRQLAEDGKLLEGMANKEKDRDERRRLFDEAKAKYAEARRTAEGMYGDAKTPAERAAARKLAEAMRGREMGVVKGRGAKLGAELAAAEAKRVARLKALNDAQAAFEKARTAMSEAITSMRALLATVKLDLGVGAQIEKLNKLGKKLDDIREKMAKLDGGGGDGGKAPVKKARGGQVHGRAGVDRIPAMLTQGEFVVNADAARAYGPELEAINAGADGYARGGRVRRKRKSSRERAAERAERRESAKARRRSRADARRARRRSPTWSKRSKVDEDTPRKYGTPIASRMSDVPMWSDPFGSVLGYATGGWAGAPVTMADQMRMNKALAGYQMGAMQRPGMQGGVSISSAKQGVSSTGTLARWMQYASKQIGTAAMPRESMSGMSRTQAEQAQIMAPISISMGETDPAKVRAIGGLVKNAMWTVVQGNRLRH